VVYIPHGERSSNIIETLLRRVATPT